MIRFLIRIYFFSFLFWAVPSIAQNVNCFNDKNIDLKEGHHYDSDFNILYRDYSINSNSFKRTSGFNVIFRNNCSYNLGNTNQADWNKVMGIVSIPNPDYTSIRLGWRWNLATSQMDLGMYGHITHGNGYVGREFLQISSIPLETSTRAELYMANNGMYAIANGTGAAIKRIITTNIALGWFERAGISRSAYFGGNEDAPHNMDIKIENHCSDIPSFWRISAINKGYTRSIFYPNEVIREFALGEINASLQAERGQLANGDPDLWLESAGQRYTTIMPGADVEFRACQRIVLQPGFRAVAGSNFRAVISCSQNDPSSSPFRQMSDSVVITDWTNVLVDSSFSKATNVTILSEQSQPTSFFQWKTYPNPSTGLYYLNLNPETVFPVKFEVTDFLGRTVSSGFFYGTTNYFNISDEAAGVYILRLESDGYYGIQKLFKSK